MRWRRILLAFLVLTLLMIVGVGMLSRLPSARANAAPPFSIVEFNGQTLSLASLHGQTVVVNFWASWCVPCRTEMPALQQAWLNEQGQGVAFVGVGVEDDEASLRAFEQSLDVTYPTGVDADGTTSRSYELEGLPTTVFVSPSGAIVRRWEGPLDETKLQGFIDEARAG